MRGRALPALLALALASCATETGGFWPQWRGPLRDNISTESDLLSEWPPEGPPVLCRVEGLGNGIGSVAVAGGRIYALGFHGDIEYLTALEEGTGQRLWSVPVGTNRGIIDHPSMRWLAQRTPTVDGDRVFAFSGDGRIACIEAATGRSLWRKDYVEDFRGERRPEGVCDFPLVDGDKVICVIGGRTPTMVALDRSTGETLWSSPTPGRQVHDYWVGEWGAVVVAELCGVRQYIASLRQGLFGFRATDGTVLWQYDRFLSEDSFTYNRTPLVSDDRVIVTTGYNGGMAGLRFQRRAGELDYDELFMRRRSQQTFTQDSSIVIGTRLYALGSGSMFCSDAETGKDVWRHRMLPRRGNASFVCFGSRLVLHFSDGSVSLAELGPEGMVAKHSFKVAEERIYDGAPMPVIAGGRLYLRRESLLSVYDIRRGQTGGNGAAGRRIVLPAPRAEPGLQTPKERQAAFVPTPQDIVRRMLLLADVKKTDLVCDLGSGDGRIVRSAARDHGARGIGYEIDPELVRMSRSLTKGWGVEHLVTIEDKDMFTADLSEVAVVALYLPEEFLEKLKPQFARLKPGARIVSHQFRIPGLSPSYSVKEVSDETGQVHAIHLYEVPLSNKK